MMKRYVIIMTVGIIFSVIISSCGREAPPAWPWWTSADSAAVMNELTSWRDTFNGFHFLRGENDARLIYPLDVNVPIISSDTAPRYESIDSIVKIAHFLGAYNVLSDSFHFNDLLFEVKNDTIETRDTFCFVTYNDSTKNCAGILCFDSLWIMKFYEDTLIDTISFTIDTIIDTIQVPPDTSYDTTYLTGDTTLIYPLDTIIKTGFSSTYEDSNNYHFTTMRKLELKKDSSVTSYRMKNLTGFTLYIPSSTDAPAISNVVLSQLTRTDTFYNGARLDKKGIYNPKSKDSLYTIAKGDSITVTINTSTPSDTVLDRNYFFVSCGTPNVTAKRNITIAPKKALGKVAFSTEGLQHLFIEVIPASTLYYPNAQWKSTTWVIPIRVTP